MSWSMVDWRWRAGKQPANCPGASSLARDPSMPKSSERGADEVKRLKAHEAVVVEPDFKRAGFARDRQLLSQVFCRIAVRRHRAHDQRQPALAPDNRSVGFQVQVKPLGISRIPNSLNLAARCGDKAQVDSELPGDFGCRPALRPTI